MEVVSVAFNELDPVACAVLRHCYEGNVLERSIKDLKSEDVAGYERVHFFAGAGLWEVACEIAGWVGPIWTGSCPCQPFSVAGKGAGTDDPRHLWPDMFRLIDGCRPRICVGEQVGGKAGYGWLDGVRADLESIGYACWAVDIPACAIDAPHRRNRIYWVAVADADGGDAGAERQQRGREQRLHPQDRGHLRAAPDDQRPEIAMANANRRGYRGRAQDALGGAQRRDAAERIDVEHAEGERWGEGRPEHELRRGRDAAAGANFWSGAEWLRCADGKARRSKPGIRLLVDGMAGRADLWRLAGNSIVPQLAAEVLVALKETLDEM